MTDADRELFVRIASMFFPPHILPLGLGILLAVIVGAFACMLLYGVFGGSAKGAEGRVAIENTATVCGLIGGGAWIFAVIVTYVDRIGSTTPPSLFAVVLIVVVGILYAVIVFAYALFLLVMSGLTWVFVCEPLLANAWAAVRKKDEQARAVDKLQIRVASLKAENERFRKLLANAERQIADFHIALDADAQSKARMECEVLYYLNASALASCGCPPHEFRRLLDTYLPDDLLSHLAQSRSEEFRKELEKRIKALGTGQRVKTSFDSVEEIDAFMAARAAAVESLPDDDPDKFRGRAELARQRRELVREMVQAE